MVGAVGLSSNGRLHLSFGLLKNWEESPPRETLQFSRAGYLRSQNVWQHLPTKLEISF